MKGAPRSERYDDVYFSAEDGLAETRHVFLDGNDLPAAWQGRADFVIAETGFGTGLNFLSVWKLFAETAEPGQLLHFISFEKHPLAAGEIDNMLTKIFPPSGSGGKGYEWYLDRLLSIYPVRIPGFHRIEIADQVTLTLIFDDVNAAMAQLEARVDCWFLDGFTPAKNPEMWSDMVFTQMARLSRSGGTFATFTAAGFVRRGLESAGFTVEKFPGFGRKRDMLRGIYKGKSS